MDKEKKPIIIETADIYLHFPYIMEEEADDLADFLEEEHIEYEGATDIFIDLQNQVKKQKEVIDKAVKLLGNYKHYSTPDEKQNSANEDSVNNAFDILKEVSE